MVDTSRLERLLRPRDRAGTRRTALALPVRPGASAPLRRVPDRADIAAAWDDLCAAQPAKAPPRGAMTSTLARDPAVERAFDMLRAQLLQAARADGWRSLAVTAPDRGCGASFVTTALAHSLGRLASTQTVVLDLDLEAPSLADAFELEAPGPISAMLDASVPPGEHLRRHAGTLALGLSTPCDRGAAALFQNGGFAETLSEVTLDYAPELVLCDLPPLLSSDAAVAALANIDAVLIVADGTRTQPADMRACEALLPERCRFLGAVLNRGQDARFKRFTGR